jgi:L-asparaginase/Glu-tRNA(Gln) amidotransferase subunit D
LQVCDESGTRAPIALKATLKSCPFVFRSVPATAISADGPLNLLNAIRTAISSEARGKGVLVVMSDEINGARDVTKTNTLRVETFRSPELGHLGYVDEDKVAFYRASTKRHTENSEFDVSNIHEFPKVDNIYSYIEPSVTMIQALDASGVKSIVFAGTGAGILSNFQKEEGGGYDYFVISIRIENSIGAFQPNRERPYYRPQGV